MIFTRSNLNQVVIIIPFTSIIFVPILVFILVIHRQQNFRSSINFLVSQNVIGNILSRVYEGSRVPVADQGPLDYRYLFILLFLNGVSFVR